MSYDELPSEPTTALQVRERLRGRWPESEYMHIEEAPEDSGRQGRKIDVLVVSLWRSRGLAVEAVEVKVSVSDFRTEIKNAHKAEKHDRKPMGWQTTVGVLRATNGAGLGALQRAHSAGREQGYKEGVKHTERGGDAHLSQQLTELRAEVAAFQEASGIQISRYPGGRRLGELVALVTKAMRDPFTLSASIRREANQLRSTAKSVDELADALAEALESPQQLELASEAG